MEALKKLRASLRRKITRIVNVRREGDVDEVDLAELEADVQLLVDYELRLREVDSQIMDLLRNDDDVSQENLDGVEDEIDLVARRLKICLNGIHIAINARKLQDNIPIGQNFDQEGNPYQSNRNNNRPKIELPKINLPEFWADDNKDKFTCKKFLENFEHMLQSYNLNDVELYNLLDRQCMGRAKAIISALHVTNQTYARAKQMLESAFAEEMPQKFSIIEEFTKLNFAWGRDDPFMYYAQFSKLMDSCKDLDIDKEIFQLYFIWRDLFGSGK